VLPYFIERIDDAAGQPIYVAEPPRACSDCWYRTGKDRPARTEGTAGEARATQVIDPRIAYQTTSMMGDVVRRGTGTRALRLGRSDIVGKTGTTNDVRDSWFAGFQADLVTVAWMGFDGFHKLGRGEEGGRAALSMWTEFMETALDGKPVAKLDPPEGMVAVSGDYGREYVMEEYRNALQGPAPVAVASTEGGTKAKNSKRAKKGGAASKPKRAAPKAIDDLF
jgi:penicillin-binding protein 1A